MTNRLFTLSTASDGLAKVAKIVKDGGRLQLSQLSQGYRGHIGALVEEVALDYIFSFEVDVDKIFISKALEREMPFVSACRAARQLSMILRVRVGELSRDTFLDPKTERSSVQSRFVNVSNCDVVMSVVSHCT